MGGDRRKGEERRIQPRETAATSMSSRRDLVGICAIELGIALQARLGTRAAADYLRQHRIRLDTALRVLLQPARRRRYGA